MYKYLLVIVFIYSSTFLFSTNYYSSGNKTWPGSGFPNPVLVGDTVFIQNSDTVTLSAILQIDGVVVIDSLCLISGAFKVDIESSGTLHNDNGGTINITAELHVDGTFYNSRNTFAVKIHNDGYICNSGTMVVSDKFDHHGGILECCGNLLTTKFKIHDNGGTPATTVCQSICSNDSLNTPTFEGITEAEFLGNSKPAESVATFPATTLCEPGVLPVSLIDFHAYENNPSVNLRWTTATEINNDYFIVERSTDLMSWKYVLTVPGAGNSNQIINYTAQDDNPIVGISYYRLQQVDYDGSYTYSNTVSVNVIENNSFFKLYPNPVQPGYNLMLDFTHIKGGEISVTIVNAIGQVFYSGFITLDNKKKDLNIPIHPQTPPGIYLVTIHSNESVSSQKLTIK